MVGRFHTDLPAYTHLLSGSSHLGRLMQEYMRWLYGKCDRILVPSLATRQTPIASKIDRRKIDVWNRGVSTEHFVPTIRSTALRVGRLGPPTGSALRGPCSTEKSLDLLPALAERLQRSQIKHRLVIGGDGPMRRALSARCTGTIFTGTLSPPRSQARAYAQTRRWDSALNPCFAPTAKRAQKGPERR